MCPFGHRSPGSEKADVRVGVAPAGRRLDPRKFRGFALADPLAPVVFVNGADSRAAQIFTLVHELGHLWLGESALSNADLVATSQVLSERWCNRLLPSSWSRSEAIAAEVEMAQPLANELQRLARRFFQMLGFKTTSTFHGLASRQGVG